MQRASGCVVRLQARLCIGYFGHFFSLVPLLGPRNGAKNMDSRVGQPGLKSCLVFSPALDLES